MSSKRKKVVFDDDDNPEMTEADFAKAMKHPGGLPLTELGEEIVRKRGRPRTTSAKVQVTLRLDPDVVNSYRKIGSGWQTRLNEDLRKARKLKAS